MAGGYDDIPVVGGNETPPHITIRPRGATPNKSNRGFDDIPVAGTGTRAWADVPGQAYESFVPSAKKLGSDLYHMLSNPIDTLEALEMLGQGLIALASSDAEWRGEDARPRDSLSLIPPEGIPAGENIYGVDVPPPDPNRREQAKEMARTVGQQFIDRYHGQENLKRTIATDPAGFLADLSGVLSLGGAAVAGLGRVGVAATTRAGTTAAVTAPNRLRSVAEGVRKTGSGLAAAGLYADPLLGPVAGAAKVVKSGTPLALAMMTGAGPRSFERAAVAGAESGEKARVFLEQMRRDAPMEEVVLDAQQAVTALGRARGAAYRERMQALGQSDAVLDFSKIDDALREVADVGLYRGKDIDPDAIGMWERIADAVDDWRMSDPSVYHTAEGLDALKRKIGNIGRNVKYGTSERIAVDNTYNAIKDLITDEFPEYARIMRDYREASDQLKNLQTAFSTGGSTDTSLRKLQSVMRPNAIANYGYRADLADVLTQQGAPHLLEKLAGQQLSTRAPRGFQSMLPGLGATAGLGLGTMSPWAAAALPLMSPRLMGEAAYYTGKVGGPVQDFVNRVGPTKMRAAAQAAYQSSRLPEEDRR